MRILTVAHAQEWTDVLRRMARHDFYFLHGYHALAEKLGEGSARLFVFESNGHLLALPLLLRPLGDVASGVPEAAGWHDATSIYGYAGPLASHTEVPVKILHEFHSALREALLAERVVAAFSRLHPLLPQNDLLAGLGEIQPCGPTVGIDLTLTPEAQRSQYRGSLRTRLNKLRGMGIDGKPDPELRHLADFAEIYRESMQRVGAQASYFFDLAFFQDLAAALGPAFRLFVATQDGQVLAGGVFTLCDGIVQYHLGGTRNSALKLSPITVVFDSVRLWAMENGARVFHLGGGVGAREDSLFVFKGTFSDVRHQFSTWRCILAPELYARLCESCGINPAQTGFFPAYRAPISAAPAGEIAGVA